MRKRWNEYGELVSFSPVPFLVFHPLLMSMVSSANCGDWVITADPKGRST